MHSFPSPSPPPATRLHYCALPSPCRSATFNVTYLDKLFRISRGDRGELRIYLKSSGLEPEASQQAIAVPFVGTGYEE